MLIPISVNRESDDLCIGVRHYFCWLVLLYVWYCDRNSSINSTSFTCLVYCLHVDIWIVLIMPFLTSDWPSVFRIDVVSMFPSSYAPTLVLLSHCLRLIRLKSCTRYCAFSVISVLVVPCARTHCFCWALCSAHVIVLFARLSSFSLCHFSFVLLCFLCCFLFTACFSLLSSRF